MERVPPDRAADESDTKGNKENWEEDYWDQKETRDRKPAVYAGNPKEEVKCEYSEMNPACRCIAKKSVCPSYF